MDPAKTALVLIGYQNDYFAPDGILRPVIEESIELGGVLDNSVWLLQQLADTDVTMIATPIAFSEGYVELVEPVGILAAIRDAGAFKVGTKGSQTIPELEAFGERVTYVPGKRGLNAFSNTDLGDMLERNGITDIVLAGAVTSICIDTTARTAHDRGYRVTILSNCTSGRSTTEQDFYCENIFPLYAKVMSSDELVSALASSSSRSTQIAS